MTFFNHGTGGGLLYAWLAWLMGARKKGILIWAGVAGFLVGAAPDIIGWFQWGFNDGRDWGLRNTLHNGGVNDYMQWTLAWGLHTWTDRFIHPYPDHKLEYMLFEAGFWILYALFGWMLVRSYRDALPK